MSKTKHVKKLLLVVGVALLLVGCGLPPSDGWFGATEAQAQEQEKVKIGGDWSLVTSVYQVYNSEYEGQWVDFGVAKRLAPFLTGEIFAVVRAGGIQDETPTAFGFEFFYMEPAAKWMDFVVGLGLNQDLIKEGEDNWDAAFVGSFAIKLHKPGGSLFGGLGGRIFQDEPGRLEAYAIGGFVGLAL